MKKGYKEVVNAVISSLDGQFAGLSKRAIINKVFDHITENRLIDDFSRTSLYNTIYYFLRKRNVFKVEEIKYRFDSISSKLKFIGAVRQDLDERWWYYHDLFFGEVERPVLATGTKVLSGQLNYIIDSKIDGRFDFLYTMLYFRDLRKVVNSDLSQIFVKRQLNDMLYGIFDQLYEMDAVIERFAKSLNMDEKDRFLKLVTNFYTFLSSFDANDYSRFHTEMIRNVNGFKKFLKETGNAEVLEFNKNRFFDAITFVNVVCSCALRHLYNGEKFKDYLNIHYLVNSTTYFVFFKFAKKLQNNNFNRLVDFFNSDLYFSYSQYIIEYHRVFYKEVAKIIDEVELLGESNPSFSGNSMIKFDIILRYMLYNKFRNLVNSNMKRYISIDFEVTDSCFVDVDDVNDCVLYECNLYCDSDPTEEMTQREFSGCYDDFLKNHCGVNRDDVTNVAIDICNGTFDPSKYDPQVQKAGMELVEILRKNIG